MQAVLLADAEQFIFQVVGFEIGPHDKLHQARAQAFLRGKAGQRKRIEPLLPLLDVGAPLGTAGLGPIVPSIVVLVMADGGGEFGLVAQAFLERLAEEILNALRRRKHRAKQNHQKKTPHLFNLPPVLEFVT
jgi:hypothetical protein